ncbi:hypothetical protein D9611_008369 [Ephemerocybe angulata]|uniref:Uncharacterized protein n=1 Tax=Ephemerocybe angulata TaxID=980116 RepID=A0A8H5F542_9AGAR|nr:hypothetical protein D9611_008369 [Tulosesus angulatus]
MFVDSEDDIDGSEACAGEALSQSDWLLSPLRNHLVYT